MNIKLRLISSTGNDGAPRTIGRADRAPGPDEPQAGHYRRAVTAWDRVAERERQLDHYRQAVEQYLGTWLTHTQGGDFERFFEHVERCFDWGVRAPACARTWVARVEARGSR